MKQRNFAEIAKKYGENHQALVDKLKLHRDTVFSMTKQYWRETSQKQSEGGEIASTAKILREAELQKD